MSQAEAEREEGSEAQVYPEDSIQVQASLGRQKEI
jgi:hypothetical protein